MNPEISSGKAEDYLMPDIVLSEQRKNGADGYDPYQIARTLAAKKAEKPAACFARTKSWTTVQQLRRTLLRPPTAAENLTR